MTTVTERPSAATLRLSDTRTLARWTAAILMPIGPAAVAVLRFVLPYDTNDSAAVMIAKVQADVASQQAVIVLGLIALFTLVPGAYAVTRLTRPGAPRLTAVAAPLLIAGYLGLGWTGTVDLLPLVAPAAGVEPDAAGAADGRGDGQSGRSGPADHLRGRAHRRHGAARLRLVEVGIGALGLGCADGDLAAAAPGGRDDRQPPAGSAGLGSHRRW